MSVESTEALERSVLEGKDREQLLAIAAALGVKATSRAKKADIIGKILEQTGSSVAADTPATPASRSSRPRNGASNGNGRIKAEAGAVVDDGDGGAAESCRRRVARGRAGGGGRHRRDSSPALTTPRGRVDAGWCRRCARHRAHGRVGAGRWSRDRTRVEHRRPEAVPPVRPSATPTSTAPSNRPDPGPGSPAGVPPGDGTDGTGQGNRRRRRRNRDRSRGDGPQGSDRINEGSLPQAQGQQGQPGSGPARPGDVPG